MRYVPCSKSDPGPGLHIFVKSCKTGTPQGTDTNSHQTGSSRKSIDSKVSAGMGYVIVPRRVSAKNHVIIQLLSTILGRFWVSAEANRSETVQNGPPRKKSPMTIEMFTCFPPNIGTVCWCSSVVISKIFVFSDVNHYLYNTI